MNEVRKSNQGRIRKLDQISKERNSYFYFSSPASPPDLLIRGLLKCVPFLSSSLATPVRATPLLRLLYYMHSAKGSLASAIGITRKVLSSFQTN